MRLTGRLADVSFGVLAVATLAGAVLYLRSAPASAPRVHVDVTPSGGGATLRVGGRF